MTDHNHVCHQPASVTADENDCMILVDDKNQQTSERSDSGYHHVSVVVVNRMAVDLMTMMMLAEEVVAEKNDRIHEGEVVGVCDHRLEIKKGN